MRDNHFGFRVLLTLILRIKDLLVLTQAFKEAAIHFTLGSLSYNIEGKITERCLVETEGISS